MGLGILTLRASASSRVVWRMEMTCLMLEICVDEGKIEGEEEGWKRRGSLKGEGGLKSDKARQFNTRYRS